MSLDMLDLAVAEARKDKSLPIDHFLCDDANIVAVKAMIKGCDAGSDIPPGKAWLYTVVNNSHSGTPATTHTSSFTEQTSVITSYAAMRAAFKTCSAVHRVRVAYGCEVARECESARLPRVKLRSSQRIATLNGLQRCT